MALASTGDRSSLERRTVPFYWVLVPFFFVLSGTHLDIAVLDDPATIVFAVIVIVVAIVGKLVGCGLAAAGMG